MSFCRGVNINSLTPSPPKPNVPNPGISQGIQAPIDCKIRALAYKYAVQLQGELRGDLHEVFDALELTDCGQTFTGTTQSKARGRVFAIPSATKTTLYVHASQGSDTKAGLGSHCTIKSPCRTVAEAVHRAASLPESAKPATILLRGGKHFVAEPLSLTPLHNNLTIMAYKGEDAVVSAAQTLDCSWTPYHVDKATGANIYVTDIPASVVKAIPGLRVNGKRAIRQGNSYFIYYY